LNRTSIYKVINSN